VGGDRLLRTDDNMQASEEGGPPQCESESVNEEHQKKPDTVEVPLKSPNITQILGRAIACQRSSHLTLEVDGYRQVDPCPMPEYWETLMQEQAAWPTF
jgi:hypothetical protein